MAEWFLQIKWLHIACVVASGTLFFLRGCLMLAGSRLASHPAIKRLSYLIDTTLLVAALLLVWILFRFRYLPAWLGVKIVLLFVYIGLGVFALRLGRTRVRRGAFFIAALAVFGFIISVAITHHPAGVFAMHWQ